MIIHKCDICGKEMGVWLKAVITVEASRPETNIADIINLQGMTEICKECQQRLLSVAYSEKRRAGLSNE